MAEPQHAPTGFPADGKGFDEKIVECFAVLQAVAKFNGFLFELFVGEFLHFGFESIDGIDSRLQFFDVACVGGAEERGDIGLDAPCQGIEKVAAPMMLTASQIRSKIIEMVVHCLEKKGFIPLNQ